jgi:hypothetical protein
VSAGPLTLERFVRGEVQAADFPHREHVRMAFEMLGRHDFAESVLHFSHTLRDMTARAGKPAAFNQTVTVAFLALIAERRESAPGADFPAFAQLHPDLLNGALLRRWYTPGQLASPLARRSFLMPDPHGERP